MRKGERTGVRGLCASANTARFQPDQRLLRDRVVLTILRTASGAAGLKVVEVPSTT